jgi:hypothetical protein
MFVLVFNPRQMCFNDDAIVKCMNEKKTLLEQQQLQA